MLYEVITVMILTPFFTKFLKLINKGETIRNYIPAYKDSNKKGVPSIKYLHLKFEHLKKLLKV